MKISRLLDKKSLASFLSVTLLSIVVLLLAGAKLAIAQSPGINNQLSFTGKVVKSDGTNISDGTYNVQFNVYCGGNGAIDSPSAGQGSDCTSSTNEHLLWTEDYLVSGSSGMPSTPGVTITSGTFQVNLGSICSLSGGTCSAKTNSAVDFNQDTLWLSIEVGNTSSCTVTSSTTSFHSNCGGDGEMGPYIRLTSVPYAFNAAQVDAMSNNTALNIGATNAALITIGNTTNSTVLYKIKNSSASAFQIQNGSSNPLFTIDTSANQTVLGKAGTGGINGQLAFNTATASSFVTTLVGNGSATGSTTITLPATGATGTQCLQSTSGSTSSATVLTFNSCGAGGTTLSSAYNSTGTSGNTIGLANAGGGIAIQDASSSTITNLFSVQNNGGTSSYLNVTSGGVQVTGQLDVNTTDNSIARATSTDFSLGTVGSNITNANNHLELTDGTPGNSGQGVVTTSSQPNTDALPGAGSMTISRPDGKYLLLKGGGTATSIYDSVANTFTDSTALTAGNGTIGAGALALPRPTGQYLIIMGSAASTTAATSLLDPQNVTSAAGPTLAATITGAGTTAYKRPDGKFLITNGAAAGTTQIYDPVSNATLVAGPTAASTTWGAGALVLPRPDGSALIIAGGASANTQVYNYPANTFTVGPSLDGNQAANTCSLNGNGSTAFRRQDGKYVILSRASGEALYDPVANTITCKASVSNVSALGDGGQAIPLQNGKFFIVAGGNTTTAYVYNQDTDTFSTYGGTTPLAVTTGGHAILRHDGSWQVITGVGCTTGCTYNFNTNLPMNDPFPSPLVAATPTSGGSCTAGNHSYFVTFVSGGVESGASPKSNVVSCTAANGTVALSGIPIGNSATTARKIYRTLAGDAGAPQLLTTINDNTTTTTNDTTADGSLGAAYSATAATTWYTSEAISSSQLNQNSTLNWTSQKEAVLTAARNSQAVNTAYTTVQFFVRTAVNGSTCAASLASAQWVEILNSGDLIHPAPGANCVQWSVHFNRSVPKSLIDDRGTWYGNGKTVHRLDYVTPSLFDISIDNSVVLRQSSWDFSQPDAGSVDNPTVPAAPTAALVAAVTGTCSTGTHVYAVTFVTNGVESSLGTASGSVSCTTGVSGSSVVRLTAIPTGPSGTTARKIYRTAANQASTSTFYLVETIADNSTTATVAGSCAAGGTSSSDDYCADTSLAAAYVNDVGTISPTTTRAEGTRVEVTNNQLTLPFGRLTQTTQLGTSGYYAGVVGGHAALHHTTTDGSVVLALPNKTFLILESGGAQAEIYDPTTDTFTDQSGTGNVPTGSIAAGAMAIKRPDGTYLVVLGGATTTNIYNPNAPSGSHFTLGPALPGGTPGLGAFSILNADGTYTIMNANGAATSSLYNPVTNLMSVGPTAGANLNCGALAIPLGQPFNNQYKVVAGAASAAAANTASFNYDAISKTFTNGTALASGTGCGGIAFQRQDGFWVILPGETATTPAVTNTSILLNPYTGATIAGPVPATAAFGGGAGVAFGRGMFVIPRADGTFLIATGGVNAAVATTDIYVPWGGAAANAQGVPQGGFMAGPSLTGGGAPSVGVAAGAGSLAFQRPDGKWMILAGQATSSVDVYDAGWYADGQYLSEQINTPALSANSTVDWQQTPDPIVRFDVKAASSQAALATTGTVAIAGPGGSMYNAGGETWVQVEINFRRDFPTFGFNQNGLYVSAGQAYSNRTISLPTVNNYQITNGRDLLNLSTNGLSVLRVTSNGNILSSAGGGFFSGGADLAERYSSTQGLNPGEVVVSDPLVPGGVLRSAGQYQPSILGVVSTAPGFVAGAYTTDSYPIALVGRVPVKISTENGPIQQGDYLTSASIPGYAMRATQAGRVIGQALESFDPSKAESCPSEGLGNLPDTKCGTILVFVNLNDYQGQSVEAAMTNAQQAATTAADTGLSVDPADLTSSSVGGSSFVFPGTTPDGQTTDEATNRSLNILSFLQQLHNSGTSNSEIFTGQLSASDQVITPTVVTNNLIAKNIKADSIEGLSVLAGNLSSLSSKVNQLGSSSSANSDGTLSIDSASVKLDLSVLGNLQAKGGLTVGGQSEFGGNSLFDKVATFFDTVVFHGNVSFDKAPTFGADTAGYAVIHKGIDRLDIKFPNEYANPPIVNAALALDQTPAPANATASQLDTYNKNEQTRQQALLAQNYSFVIYGRTSKGFTIILNKPATDDLLLTWTALAVTSPQTSQSAPTPAVQPTTSSP